MALGKAQSIITYSLVGLQFLSFEAKKSPPFFPKPKQSCPCIIHEPTPLTLVSASLSFTFYRSGQWMNSQKLAPPPLSSRAIVLKTWDSLALLSQILVATESWNRFLSVTFWRWLWSLTAFPSSVMKLPWYSDFPHYSILTCFSSPSCPTLPLNYLFITNYPLMSWKCLLSCYIPQKVCSALFSSNAFNEQLVLCSLPQTTSPNTAANQSLPDSSVQTRRAGII